MFLLWMACIGGAPAMREFDDLSWFVDQTGEPCSLSPARALSTSGLWRSPRVATDGDELYLTVSENDGSWFFVLDAATGETLGTLELPDVSFAASVDVAGDRAFVASGNRSPEVVVIDTSDPAAPSLLATVELGKGAEPSAFAVWEDRAYTDGGDTLYLDLSGAPVAVSAAPNELLGVPLIVGDELLATVPEGASCALQVFDPAGPTALATLDTAGACLSAGLVALDDGSVLGFGWRLEGDVALPVAQRFTRDPAGWLGEAPLDLPLSDLGPVASTGDGGFAIGVGGPLGITGGVTLGGTPLAVQQTWWPDTYYRSNVFLADAAGAQGTTWVAVSVESGEFDGVVQLAPGVCP
jgi:hypothetical protein